MKKTKKKEKPIRSLDEFRRRFLPESYARGDFKEKKPLGITIFLPRPGP